MTSNARRIYPSYCIPIRRDVAFIGLATGITAGASLLHQDVESVTAIELSPLVAQACEEQFSDVNGGIFTDPRAKVVVEDGRTYLASCEEQFDVVAGDLFLPWRQGVGRLYSLEHYRTAWRSLRAGGLYCQMLPMYQLNNEQADVIIRTLLEVFPEVHLFRLAFNADAPSLALVGFKDATLDWNAVANNCQALRRQGQIRDPIVRHADGLMMLHLGTIARDTFPTGQFNTLGNAWVELYAGRSSITGKWNEEFFLTNERWFGFEKRLASLYVKHPSPGQDVEALSLLGQQIMRWYLAHLSKNPSAEKIRREISSNFPDALRTDRDADRSVWIGWKVLLN